MGTAMREDQTALVTGGSGYLGSWAIVTLLQQGFRVRTTVRSPAREGEVRAMIAGQVDPADRLAFITADLLKDEGWEQAVDGCSYAIHTASPMPVGEYRGQDIITPAREGTRRVLDACAQAGVRRVVLTSSATAARPPPGESAALDETRWTELEDGPAYAYTRAKTLAERDAWELVRGRGGRMELTTVLPGFIQGPVLSADYSGSVSVVSMMLLGKIPAVPRVGFNIVDVRDLADVHVRAMLAPAAAGERFLAAGEFLWLSDIATLLHQQLGERAAKAPTRVMPDWLVRSLAPLNPEMAQIVPELGLHRTVDASKAQRMLGWQTRPAAESIIDTANSMIERGLA